MTDVKWIKIVTDIFDDEKILLIESMPEADSIIVIWFKLLCLAGKQNNCGVFMLNNKLPYTDEMLATIFRRNVNTVRMALSLFEQFGMIEVINHTITIPNWEKHQNTCALEKAREATRLRVARHRERQKLLTNHEVCGDNQQCNVTDGVTGNVTEPVTVTARNALRIDKNKIYNTPTTISYDIKGVTTDEAPESAPNAFAETDDRPDTTTVEYYASSNLQYMGVHAFEELQTFKDDMSEELIRHAIDLACDNAKRTWSYVRGILNRYVENGIKTVGEAKAMEERWKKQKTGQVEPDSRGQPKNLRELRESMGYEEQMDLIYGTGQHNPLDDPLFADVNPLLHPVKKE